MPKDEQIFAITRENNETFGYATGSRERVDEIAAKWNGDSSAAEVANSEVAEEENTFSHHTALSETLSAATDFCLSQYQILGLLSSIQSGLYQSYIKINVLKRLEKSNVPCEDVGDCKIYEIDDAMSEEIAKADKRGEVLRLGSGKIGPSVFLGMVASFDALIVDIVGKLIQLNPERYVASEKTVAIGDIINAASKDDIIKGFVADELYRFSRESHDSQNSYIEKNFNIKIKESWKRYPDFIEVFERRNLIAHGEPAFNMRYASICEAAGHKGMAGQVGKPIELRYAYQEQALFILSEYAILLSFALWRKHAADKEKEAFETLNETGYKLIQDGHFILAERILSFALSLKNIGVSEEIRKMMVVNCASAARSMENDGKANCTKVLNREDWTASSLPFQLSVAALKEEIDIVVDLIPQVKNIGFELSNFRQWPVFRFIKDNAEFNDALEKNYGERLSKAPRVLEEAKAPDVGELTMH